MQQLELFDSFTEHIAQFYESVAVEVFKSAFGKTEVAPKMARFWFMSQSPRMAWVVGWACRGDAPTLYLINVAHITILRDAHEPPPMPEWTKRPVDSARAFESLGAHGG